MMGAELFYHLLFYFILFCLRSILSVLASSLGSRPCVRIISPPPPLLVRRSLCPASSMIDRPDRLVLLHLQR